MGEIHSNDWEAIKEIARGHSLPGLRNNADFCERTRPPSSTVEVYADGPTGAVRRLRDRLHEDGKLALPSE